LTASWSSVDAHPQADLILDQIAVETPAGAQFVELVEDQVHSRLDLLVRITDGFPGGQLDIPAGEVEKQRAPFGLVQPVAFQSIMHENQLIFTNGSLKAQDETVLGVTRVIDAVLVRQQRSEDGTHLHEMMPILVVAGHAAHLDPQDQADMIQGNFGQDAVKSRSSSPNTTGFRRPSVGWPWWWLVWHGSARVVTPTGSHTTAQGRRRRTLATNPSHRPRTPSGFHRVSARV